VRRRALRAGDDVGGVWWWPPGRGPWRMRLARAGLVERHRVRRRVFYALNDTGASLVALLADVPAALSA
jgi:hypothetical protein